MLLKSERFIGSHVLVISNACREEWHFLVVLFIFCYCVSHHDGPNDEMRFTLGHRSIWFSKVEFCLITGLKFGAIPDTAVYEDVQNGIHHMYFCGRAAVTFPELEASIEQGQWQEQSDAMKQCLLYMLNCVLIGVEERNFVPI
ncbi:hypothetical protein Dsin_021860 [Dipteronia sinensis]|uniref:DUF1985 domain-containing protein n=1 Tax=Dipteronia sinensis TaxID=43782 RepID=A0AAE0DZ70_9ROSI|nr:hypothetical protein Dsin_021860 [Dipteronia sinensis]